MKIIYKNFTIEDDRNCFRLSETKTVEKWDNKWDTYEADVTYPSTLLHALVSIRNKIHWNNTIELTNLIEETIKINDKFISDLKEIL